MNDQEALTEAARLLRESADPLQHLGRWEAEGNGGVDMRTGMRDSYSVGPYRPYPIPADVPPRGIMATIGWGTKHGHQRSQHIAGLDPAVALVMAELFEEYATRFPNRTPEQHGDVARRLIAVARTYLRDPA